MHLTTQEVTVGQLETGMYVSKLDIPWVQTPFPIQGFFINSPQDIQLLSHYCNKVYVDTFLSKIDVSAALKKLSSYKKNTKHSDPKIERLMSEKARFKPRVKTYFTTKALKKSMAQAAEVYGEISLQLSAIYRNLDQQGFVQVGEIIKICNRMVQNIIENPNALLWLARIQNDHSSLHQQALRSALWAMIFTRHLGLDESDIRDVGVALMLAPIGKCKLFDEHGTSLNTESEEYKQHVDLTLVETKKMFNAHSQVNYILSSYCERHNASGYPRQLAGNKIPFLSRVAGLADYYEQLINPLQKDNALTSVEAVSFLYQLRGETFQSELIEEFIKAIGIYPTGSLVKLNDNRIALVMEQPEHAKLRPTVAVLKDEANNDLENPPIINLADTFSDPNVETIAIEKSLKSTCADISAEVLFEKLFTEKKWFSFLS